MRWQTLWSNAFQIIRPYFSYFNKLWSSQLGTQFKQLRIEAWKSQDFNGVWPRDLAIPVQRSNQLNYEATDVESWSFVICSQWGMNVKWYMKCFIYWTADLKSSKLWSSQLWTQFKQLRIEAWKSQEFNEVMILTGYVATYLRMLQHTFSKVSVILFLTI